MDSLEPPLELATPGKVSHSHISSYRSDTLIQLKNLEHTSPLVFGSVLPGSEHERDIVPEHGSDVGNKLLDTRSMPLEFLVEEAVQAVRDVGVVVSNLHTVLASRN